MTTSAAAAKTMNHLRRQYQRSKAPVEVDFRSLVDLPSYPERATHLLHPYPAKLLAHIPYFLIRAYTNRSARVVDPFCGSGTVLLEGALAGRNCYGADSNPLARIITRVKVTPLSVQRLRSTLASLSQEPLSRSLRAATLQTVRLDNPLHWYSKSRLAQLHDLAIRISHLSDAGYRAFFAVCLAACARVVSNADPRIGVPVRLRDDKYSSDSAWGKHAAERLRRLQRCSVADHFVEIATKNICRMGLLNAARGGTRPTVRVGIDARSDLGVTNADLVITSPPYLAAQKYLRFSSLGLAWLELTETDVVDIDRKAAIGREFFPKGEVTKFIPTGIARADRFLRDIHRTNPLRAHLVSTYLREMVDAIDNAIGCLSGRGKIVLVVADTRVLGRRFPTTDYLTYIVEQYGLLKEVELVDGIRGRTLLTKRNGMGPVVANEHIIVFS